MKSSRYFTAVLLLAGLVFVYFSHVLLTDKIFTFRDLSRYYYPLRLFAFEQIKSGNFPFWNPCVGSGHPLFAAVQSVVLYPLSFVYLLGDFDFAFNFFIVLHIFLGGAFFYVLMRDLKFSHISGLLSATVFMFSGYLIAVINLTTTLAAAIWFPLVFLFYNRAIKNRSFACLAGSSFFLGVMFLGGEPTPMYSTVFMLGIYSLMQAVSDPKSSRRIFLWFAAFFALFLLLFAFQLLPFIELLRLSNRSQSLFEGAVLWSFPPRDIINFLLPFFYGPLHFQLDTPLRQDWLLLTYLGVVPVLLFLVSCVFDKSRLSLFFKIIFLAGLAFVFGRFTPLYKIFYKFLPGFNLIRYPVKFFFLNAVSFAYLCGSGWQEYTRRTDSGDKKFTSFIKGLFAAGFVAAIIFLLLYVFKVQIYSLASAYIKGMKFEEEYTAVKYYLIFNVDMFNFRRMLVFFIIGTLLLFIGAKKKINLVALGMLLLALTYVDLYGGKNVDINPVISRKVLHEQTPNITFLKKDKSLFRVYTSSKMNKLNEALRGFSYEEAFAGSIDNLCPNRMIEYGISDARGYFSLHNSNYSKVLNLVDTSPLPSSTNILRMLNVKYVLTPEKVDDPKFLLASRGRESYLYENTAVLPRAYLAGNYVVLKNELDIANKLKSREFDPAKEVILEEIPNPGPVSTGPQAKEGVEFVRIVRYDTNEVVVEAAITGKPKFMVLADNYYPGWKAFVDGKKSRIYKADFVLRAVYLPEGRHTVRFVFDPFSFKAGLTISIATLLVLCALIRKKR